MTSDARTLFVHTGVWKTGSTALQAHLNFNRARLAEIGVSYEFPDRADRGGGNGAYLCSRLLGHHIPTDELSEHLETLFAARKTAICSCETFTSFGEAEWEQLLDSAKPLGIQVRTITYVRDVAPYYQSLYAQGLREGRHCRGLAEFCLFNVYAPVVASLRTLAEHIGPAKMTVLHYESTKHAIDTPFMAALRIDAGLLSAEMLSKRINRSFSSYEVKVLTRLVQRTGQQFASELADLLLKRRPDLESDQLLDSDVLQRVQERHGGDIKWINDEFFAHADVLAISRGSNTELSPRSANDQIEQAIDRDIADWCLAKLESVQQASVDFVAQRVASIDWEKINNPALPQDFDPLAYLLLNSDVLKAGVAPCEHYISAGRHEKDRRWKWQSR